MAIHTTSNAARAWAPDLIAVPVTDAVPDLLALDVTTVAGSINGDTPAVRVPFVDDDEAEIVAEGATIDEAEPSLSEVLVNTSKVAQLLRISRELYSQSSTASLLSGSVSRAIIRKADSVLIDGDAGANITGLLDATSIETADPVADDLDPLVDLVAAIEANGGTATHLIVAPDTWAALRKIKVGTGSSQSLLGAGTDDADRRLLGLPVRTSAAVPTGEGLIVDKTAIVSALGPVEIATSEDVYFSADSIGVRATLRIGTKPVRGDRIAKFTIGD